MFKLTKKTNKQENPFYNKLGNKWSMQNEWFMQDEELSMEAFKIHYKLVKSDIEPDTEKYWQMIDIELYKNRKDLLLKYYSHNN